MEPSETANSSSKRGSICEECKTNLSKYKCPSCSIRSCSLPCVKSHKLRTACTGKKQYNDVVPLSQFDDNLIISDYYMLEDVKRVAESAHRARVKLGAHANFRLPFPQKSLRSAAGSRRTKILFLPSGMLKRQANKTYYNNRKKFISWTVELRFHLTDVVLVDHGVHEDTSLCSVIGKHFQPGPWNHKLKQFSAEPLDSLKLFIRKFPKGPKSPFRELDIKASLREQLANLVILEYPVIHIFLPSHSIDFEVVRDVPRKVVQKEIVNDGSLSPKGVIFREEEIEDGGSIETHVSDLLHLSKEGNNVIEEHDHQLDTKSSTEETRGTLAAEPETADINIENQKVHPGVSLNEFDVFEDMDFVFDQELMNAYSDILGDANAGDFLDFEGIFKEDVPGGTTDQANVTGIFSVDEELEEGEIPL
ncbi:hypothetical protein Leryth_008152 [Lithospermum erythrorhizon]|nr:hypothetical protein Leryth_008152 [Lithospermum erythrorhizon]